MIDRVQPTPADADRLMALADATFTATFGELYSPENLERFLREREPAARAAITDPAMAIRIAEVEGEGVGFATLGPPKSPHCVEPPPELELFQLYVVEEWKGTGVSELLMDWAMGEARARGSRAIQLSVFTENLRAQAFYRRYGFAVVGEHHFMVGDQADDDLIMRAAL